ncbi:MAG: YcxB family protein [Eubacteriales bacterium]|nr:YcxB family protein [Eubacteriales bacterium]
MNENTPKMIITKIGLKEWDLIGHIMYPNSSILIVHVFALICVVLVFRSYTNGNTAFATYYLLLGIVLEGFTHLARYNRLKANRRFFEQEYGDNELVLTYTFGTDGFKVHNELSGDDIDYKYESLIGYKENDEYLILKSKERQYFIISRVEADAEELLDFLKEKLPELVAFK